MNVRNFQKLGKNLYIKLLDLKIDYMDIIGVILKK